MKLHYSYLLAAVILPISLSAEAPSLTPPQAKPGECYARVVLPAKYETVEEKVLVKEPTEEIKIIPAEYETVEEEVVVVPESKKLVTIPATYKKVKETIEVAPTQRLWKTGLKKNAKPVSKALLEAIKASGVNLEMIEPNHCLKEYYVPAQYKTVTEEVVVQEEHNETKVIPAEFDTVEETVVVVPERNETVEIPPEYETVEEKVLVEEAKTIWKKGQNPASKLPGATGEIMCLVKVPAKYKTLKKKVVKTPAHTEAKTIPAETKTVKVKKMISAPKTEVVTIPAETKIIEKKVLETPAKFIWIPADQKPQAGWKPTGNMVCLVEIPAKTKEITKVVLDTPETLKEEIIPAKTKTVKVKKLLSPAKTVKVPVEAEYRMLKKRKKIADTHVGWERILCQTNMTKDVVARIQSALNERGYNAGKPDGILGRGTQNALDQFQRDNSLATGGITYETLNALGITL
jgi:hypothetical protein